jgi:signal transduction histidine kinase
LQEKRLEHLSRISSAIEQMNSMVEDVLLLSEAEAGNLQLKPAPVDLVQLCRSLVSELIVADRKQHNITFTPMSECKVELSETTSLEREQAAPMEYFLDEKLVRYILINLLGNALKYSPPGSAIQLDLTCYPDHAVFRIQDQGIGIPSKDMPRLFESFHRASNVATTQGTGLGLAIVKQCVDLHGGQISVDSLVGKGSTFTVTLPSIHSIGVQD